MGIDVVVARKIDGEPLPGLQAITQLIGQHVLGPKRGAAQGFEMDRNSIGSGQVSRLRAHIEFQHRRRPDRAGRRCPECVTAVGSPQKPRSRLHLHAGKIVVLEFRAQDQGDTVWDYHPLVLNEAAE